MTEHDWKFVRRLHNGTHLWKCARCGGESWTNVQDEDPPSRGDLENSQTPEDCDRALVVGIMHDKDYGHGPPGYGPR